MFFKLSPGMGTNLYFDKTDKILLYKIPTYSRFEVDSIDTSLVPNGRFCVNLLIFLIA